MPVNGLRMGRWPPFFFCSFLALPSERIIAHWPVGAPRRIPAAQAKKKKYPKSQISHLVHPLNSFRFASNFHILLGRAVEVKSFIARVSTAADV